MPVRKVTKQLKNPFGLALSLVIAGCSADYASSKAQTGSPTQDSPDTPGFVYVPVGVNERGCRQYTKRPTKEGVAVDAAIWYRSSDGGFTTDADACDPVTDKPREKPP
jgi:hypothetical protein